EPSSGPVFVAVGGGKGGVGKTFVASSLALALARSSGPGLEVVAVDLDVGGSNLNLFFGEPVPERELADWFEGRIERFADVARPTRLAGLRYVAGSFDTVTAGDPLRQRKLELIRGLVGLEADVVVLDLPAGSSPATLDFYFLGDHKVVVTSPEPAAFHDAYGFLKNYLLRRILTELREREEVVLTVLEFFRGDDPSKADDRTLTSMMDALRRRHPKAWPEVVSILREDVPLLILNRLHDPRERQYLDRFRAVVRKNLALQCGVLGTIPEEKRVTRAVRDAKPFVLEHPRHEIAKRFSRWAARIADARR
ncbi:MAG: P-loop NTPase, partial [Gemmatimonadota bacterium]|nr:P-loop NTPase [Gemmatimonadota bacterium]